MWPLKHSGWGQIDLFAADVNVSSPTLLLHVEENGFDFAQLIDLLPFGQQFDAVVWEQFGVEGRLWETV